MFQDKDMVACWLLIIVWDISHTQSSNEFAKKRKDLETILN
jgi:hypothetical protein